MTEDEKKREEEELLANADLTDEARRRIKRRASNRWVAHHPPFGCRQEGALAA